MSHLKSRVAIVLTALALLVAGTGGVSTMAGDRPLELSTASDDQAYVEVEITNQSLDPGRSEAVHVGTISNRFEQPLTGISVTIHSDEPSAPILQESAAPVRLEPGETGDITVTVVCDAAGATSSTEVWSLSIHAAGEDVNVDTVRPLKITCEVTSNQ